MNLSVPDTSLYTIAKSGVSFYTMNRGLIRATGTDRLDLLHRLSTNATLDLVPGKETTTILTSDKGRVVEVVRVIALENELLLLLQGTDTPGTIAWLDKYTIMDDFVTADIGAQYAVIGVYGDYAKSVLKDILEADPPDSGSVTTVPYAEGTLLVLRDTRIIGATGFLLIAPTPIVDELCAQLEFTSAVRLDEGTFNTLRIEAGVPAMGTELTESYNPLEAGLAQWISWTKGCYIGQEVIARLDTYDKVQRHLVGLKFAENIPSDTVTLIVLNSDDRKKIGEVTSAAFSPGFGSSIGLAYIRTQYAVPGTVVTIADSEESSTLTMHAEIVKLPF